MRNKNKKWNREDWISVVITLVFILGFLVLANSGTEITGLTTVEPVTTIDFEINSVIPSTAILEISSGTQIQQMNLSEFTVKLSELENIRPIFENDKLVAYNITNMTIDLAEYGIEPGESATIRFMEVYKEITEEIVTKRITKEEIITEEIVSVTENITEEPEKNVTITAEELKFVIQPTEIIEQEFETEEFEFKTQATTTLTVYSTTQGASVCDDLPTAAELNTNNNGWEGQCDSLELFYVTWSNITNCEDSSSLTSVKLNAKIRVESGFDENGYQHYLSTVTAEDPSGTVYCSQTATPATTTDFSIITLDCALDTLDTVGEINSMYGHFDNEDAAPKDWFQIDYANVTVVHDCDLPNVAPVVEIWWPENNTQSPSHSANFTYNVTDSDSGANGEIINCSLLLQTATGWGYNSSNKTAITEGANATINITLGHENINWTIQCEDAGGLKANATNGYFNYTVYDTTPSPSLVSPVNNTYNISHSANFTYQVTSLDSVINCTLLLEKGGVWEYNKSNQSAITEGIDQSINITLGHESINWTIQCENIYDEKANATNGYFNYTVYDATPSVNLVWPGNNTYQQSSKSVNLTYNVTSPDSSLTCDLYINDAWNSTDTGIERSVNQTFNLTFASYQNFNWSVGCNNTFDEYVNSTMYNYSLFEQLNQPPTIPTGNISAYSPATPTVLLDNKRVVSLTFAVCDPDSADVSGLTPYANVTGANDTNNYYEENITCIPTGWSNSSCKQINCSFNLWYWYKQGSWNISMNVTDGTYWAHNNAPSFNLGSTTGIVISPSALEWSTLYSGQWNKTSSNDPILINNTGNYNVSLSAVNVTAYNLRGEKTGYESDEIPAANFTIGLDTDANNIECIGTAMSNATSTNIPSSMLPRGNHSINNNETGQENLFFCLVNIPYSISEQSYSTQNSYQWKIGVS